MCDKNAINLERLRNLINTDTRENIAKALSCDTSLVTRHYNNERKPSVEHLKCYAKHFHVTTDYLLGLSDAETENKDIKYICDYTGLTPINVDYLHCLDCDGDSFMRAFINLLLNEIHTIETIISIGEIPLKTKELQMLYLDANDKNEVDEDYLIFLSKAIKALKVYNGDTWALVNWFTNTLKKFALQEAQITTAEYQKVYDWVTGRDNDDVLNFAISTLLNLGEETND